MLFNILYDYYMTSTKVSPLKVTQIMLRQFFSEFLHVAFSAYNSVENCYILEVKSNRNRHRGSVGGEIRGTRMCFIAIYP
jgi:hypothetical protein